jgi:hypothetical protein
MKPFWSFCVHVSRITGPNSYRETPYLRDPGAHTRLASPEPHDVRWLLAHLQQRAAALGLRPRISRLRSHCGVISNAACVVEVCIDGVPEGIGRGGRRERIRQVGAVVCVLTGSLSQDPFHGLKLLQHATDTLSDAHPSVGVLLLCVCAVSWPPA